MFSICQQALWGAMNLMRFTKLIIYNLGLLLALLFLAETGFRISHPDYAYYERSCAADFYDKAWQKLDTNWVHIDTTLGWVCRQKKYLKFYQPDYSEVAYAINSAGFRSPEFTIPRDTFPRPRRVLLLGDSFLFGIFLENDQTISAKIQQQLGTGFEVFNLAIPGWGLDQMFQAYSQYVQRIQPDIVLLFYIDDDISRLVEAFYWGAGVKNAYSLKKGELTLRHPEEGQLNELESFFCFNSQMVNRLYKIGVFQKALPLSKAILQEMIESEKASGRALITVRFPRREQIGNERLKKYDLEGFFQERHCTHQDLEKAIRFLPKEVYAPFFIKQDDHPSERGADFIAKKLVDLIEKAS